MAGRFWWGPTLVKSELGGLLILLILVFLRLEGALAAEEFDKGIAGEEDPGRVEEVRVKLRWAAAFFASSAAIRTMIP